MKESIKKTNWAMQASKKIDKKIDIKKKDTLDEAELNTEIKSRDSEFMLKSAVDIDDDYR